MTTWGIKTEELHFVSNENITDDIVHVDVRRI